MPRIARVVIADVAHHVTQRGNGRQFLLATDIERMVYLDMLRRGVREHDLLVLGYCLMSNHVHLVVIPRRAEALSEVLRQVHGRYAAYWNGAHGGSGHAWQGRFYSCPMDPGQQWVALRYAELNPVRAGLVKEAVAWPWSSAGAHSGTVAPDTLLEMTRWRQTWGEVNWRQFLAQGETESELYALRRATWTGRPLGAEQFTRALEEQTHRRLTVGKPGRPRKAPGGTYDPARAGKS